MKDEVALATGVKTSFIEEEKDNFRTILQWWGTDFRRKYNGDDYWIKKFLDKVTRSDADVIVVTDVRFPNEADTIRQVGGKLIRVNRIQDKKDLHPSEIALDNYRFDWTIINDYSLDILKTFVKQILTHILEENKKLCTSPSSVQHLTK